MKKIRLISIGVLALNLAFFAKSAAPVDDESVLPGQALKLEDAVSRAEVIAVAVLVDLGAALPRAAGQARYEDAKFKVSKRLKGRCGNTVILQLILSSWHPTEMVKEGSEYIIFIVKGEDFEIGKMMAADQGNVERVAAAIAANH